METTTSSFAFLKVYGPLYFRLAQRAEQVFSIDPALTLIALRQLGEAFAQHAAARAGIDPRDVDNQLELLRLLEQRGIVREHIGELFHALRRQGNRAVHDFTGSRQEALDALHLAFKLACWFHRTFDASRMPFAPAPYAPPQDPTERLRTLEAAAAQARTEADAHRDNAVAMQLALATEAARRQAEEQARKQAEAERQVYEQIAVDYEAELAKANAAHATHLQLLTTEAQQAPAQAHSELVADAAAATLATQLSEDETRLLIDAQLRAAGWTVDTKRLRYEWGVRPKKGENLAIAEWPTHSQADGDGRADYVLFVGLVPVAVVEAKKKATKIPSAIEQAKRYSRGLQIVEGEMIQAAPLGVVAADFPGWPSTLSGTGPLYKVPFLYATNGRPYLRQLETESGIWFLDARHPTNHPRPLTGWHTPGVLSAMLAHDAAAADQRLHDEPIDVVASAIKLRPYQVEAIRAVEQAVRNGQRSILVAMATGTGKTRTVVGLIHRLLKSQRFRRVLFLVDRTSLGEQAASAFHEVQLENLQSFAKNYDVKGLDVIEPAIETKVHIATVQGMVRRILQPAKDDVAVPIDRYDCVIVDESHRGYTLDREMTEGEIELRGMEDYVSTYRRVLDHFDAVKIGLTATPALQTREIFGAPVYQYSYREAVADGFLVDHGPPLRIVTKLAKTGITFEKGTTVEQLLPEGGVQLSLLPDEMTFEIDAFNRAVIAPDFNRAVAEELALHLDPTGEQKTIIFCVDDDHAELLVPLLKTALKKQWGDIEDNAVRKITGKVDKPLAAIRHFKNEPLPNIAVTVDLLTTGIDVPAVCNIVFLRRVRSRILYEQMLGRATRLCPGIDKEVFRIFDAVDLYDALEPVSEIKPLVKDVTVTTGQMLDELLDDKSQQFAGAETGSSHADDLWRSIIEKMRRVERRIEKHGADADVLQAVNTAQDVLGCSLKALPDKLKELGTAGTIALFKEHPGLKQVFERISAAALPKKGAYLSNAVDEVVSAEHGYGEHNQKPDDYLEAFAAFVKQNQNAIEGLKVVCTSPKSLTRKQLKELRIKLDTAGFAEATVRAAWKDAKQQDIAASIIGFVRQRALGSPLLPYDQRVERALQKIIASEQWTNAQLTWLRRIGEQVKTQHIVVEELLESAAFASHGGVVNINRMFNGRLHDILDRFGDEIWNDEAAA